MKIFSILSILFLSTFTLDAIEIDTSYIKKYDEQLLLKVSGNNHNEDYRIQRHDQFYNLRPNSLNKIKLLFSYQWLSAGFSVSPRFMQGENNDEDKKGESTMYNFGFNLNFDRWMQSFESKYTKGFYLANTGDFEEGWDPENDNYIQFPDITYFEISGYTAYKFNPNYSIKSVSTQTERQLKSAGSFVPLIYYSYYRMNSPTPLYEDLPTQVSNNFELSLQIGYFYTHVLKRKWYYSAGVTTGSGFVYTHLKTEEFSTEEKFNYTSLIFRSTANLGFGYNGRRWASGINLKGHLELFPSGNDVTIVTNNHISGQVFVSYRFNTPRVVKETVDRIPMPDL